jgi:hypothetical protein
VAQPLYEHQKTALQFLSGKPYGGLFYEPGLGKTRIILEEAAALRLSNDIDCLVVIAPNGVHAQWVNEQAPVHLAAGTYAGLVWPATKWDSRVPPYTLRIFTMNYEATITKKGKEFLIRLLMDKRCMLVLDESSRIRNHGAKRTKTLIEIGRLAKYRRILTGTPAPRGLENLFSQMTFLSQDILGMRSFYSFRGMYCVLRPIPGAPPGAMQVVGYQNTEDLHRRVGQVVQSATKDDCLDLPDKVYERVAVPLTAEQRAVYDDMRDTLIASLDSGEIITTTVVIAARAKMRQIALGFIIDENGEPHDLPTERWERAAELAAAARGKTTIWAGFRHAIDRTLAACRAAGLNCVSDTEEGIQRFINDPDVKVLVASPMRAGIGRNFAFSDTMIWTHNVDDAELRWQGEDRSHRIGQTRSLTIIDLMAPNTVDTKIWSALKHKEQVQSGVMKGARAMLGDVI